MVRWNIGYLERKYRPLIGIVFDFNGSAVILHILMGNKEAKACAFMQITFMFSGKIGIKNIADMSRWNSLAIVLDINLNNP